MTVLCRSLRATRYAFTALTLAATLAALLAWMHALVFGESMALAFVWSILAGAGAVFVMAFEHAESWGE